MEAKELVLKALETHNGSIQEAGMTNALGEILGITVRDCVSELEKLENDHILTRMIQMEYGTGKLGHQYIYSLTNLSGIKALKSNCKQISDWCEEQIKNLEKTPESKEETEENQNE